MTDQQRDANATTEHPCGAGVTARWRAPQLAVLRRVREAVMAAPAQRICFLCEALHLELDQATVACLPVADASQALLAHVRQAIWYPGCEERRNQLECWLAHQNAIPVAAAGSLGALTLLGNRMRLAWVERMIDTLERGGPPY